VQFILFTKSLKGMTVPQMIETARGLGFDGLDMAVREGYAVNPGNAAGSLPAAARACAEAGLGVPMVSTDTGAVDPLAPGVEQIFAACAEAGCGLIKIGYWSYQFPGYWEQLEQARRALAGFARLSGKYGVKTAVHTHSGMNLAGNCAMAMQLVKGLDAGQVGIYVDPGHLALDGEKPRMGLDMVREYLCAVAVKDCRYVRKEGEDKPVWEVEWLRLREGLVPWREVTEALKEMAFDGPVSFHCEYHQPLETIIEWTRDDVRFLRALTG